MFLYISQKTHKDTLKAEKKVFVMSQSLNGKFDQITQSQVLCLLFVLVLVFFRTGVLCVSLVVLELVL